MVIGAKRHRAAGQVSSLVSILREGLCPGIGARKPPTGHGSLLSLVPGQRGPPLAPVAIQTWSLTDLQPGLFKTGGRLHSVRSVLRPPGGRKSLDREHLSADPRAHRATRVATLLRTVHWRDTGSWIIACRGVCHERQTLGGCGIGGAGAARTFHRDSSNDGVPQPAVPGLPRAFVILSEASRADHPRDGRC
jgi:hypothetical protein